jgi:hypothetical protein
MKVPALLKNKYICYALMALATLNIIGYVTVRAWECLALFALAGYSCHCYCKNVSCSILAALFVANFVFGCGRVKEGFEEMTKGPGDNLDDAKDSLEKASAKFVATAELCGAEGTCDDSDKKKACEDANMACHQAAANIQDATEADKKNKVV